MMLAWRHLGMLAECALERVDQCTAWQALGEYDLSVDQPQAALQALQAAVYLNPEAVAPRASIAENGELLSIQNAYLQALRAVGSKGGTAAH